MCHLRNIAPVLCVLLIGVAEAQRPNQRGRNNARGPQGNRGGVNKTALNRANNGPVNNGLNAANQGGQIGVLNGLGNRGGMDPGQMAQALVANFDNDGNGALDVNELIAALQGLRQMIQNGGGQNVQARGGQGFAAGGQQGFAAGNANQNGGRLGQRPGPPGQNAGGRPGGNGNRGQRGRGR
ncbi:MAG: hypothetical protein AAFU85_13115 [Planctomycetota bacterium]